MVTMTSSFRQPKDVLAFLKFGREHADTIPWFGAQEGSESEVYYRETSRYRYVYGMHRSQLQTTLDSTRRRMRELGLAGIDVGRECTLNDLVALPRVGGLVKTGHGKHINNLVSKGYLRYVNKGSGNYKRLK